MSKYCLILGSSSPRRKELISYLKIPFEVRPFPFDEKVSYVDPIQSLYQITQEKLDVGIRSIATDWKSELVPFLVVADTAVILGNQFLGKPKNRIEAKEMLLRLSGHSHVVATAVGIKCEDKMSIFHCETKVNFKVIDPYLLDCYIESEDGLDKAGGYGIQGMAQLFVHSIEGNYSNVVGFPLFQFTEELRKFFAQKEGQSTWSNYFAQLCD